MVFGISFGGSTKTESGSRDVQRNTSNTATTTPNIPEWWLSRYNAIDSGLGADGMTGDQRAAADFLRGNLTNNPLAGAYGIAHGATADALGLLGRYGGQIDDGLDAIGHFGGQIDSGVGAINRFGDAIGASTDAVDGANTYLQNQLNNGSFTLGRWFPEAVTSANSSAANAGAANAPAVGAGTGAAFMGAYDTPLSNDYVNASLADYDAGAARGFNALRAGNASAFGNKRTGVAEGQFMADAARGRGTLGADLRLNAFNTAAGLGQTDASRALAADTTNAGNLLNNSQFNANALLNNNQFNARQAQDNAQFNANLTDSRQKFDAGQAETGEQRRLGVANDLIAAANARANINATGAGIAAQGVNAASQGVSAASHGVDAAAAGVNAAVQRAALGARGLDNAVNFNAANVGNATALGNLSNMTLEQLFALLNLGQAGIGSTRTETGNETSHEQTKGSQSGAEAGLKFRI